MNEEQQGGFLPQETSKERADAFRRGHRDGLADQVPAESGDDYLRGHYEGQYELKYGVKIHSPQQ